MQHTLAQKRLWVRWAIAAAVVAPALSLLAPSVRAQYLVGQDGSARDANNRVGSGGKNGGGPRSGVLITPNQIANGNVTNGKEFRGPLGSGDARAFRGDTGSVNSDQFIRSSSGGYDRGSFAESLTARPYYGDSRGVPAPANYIPITVVGTPWAQNSVYTNRLPQSYGSLNTGENITPRLGTSTTIIGAPNDGSLSSQNTPYLVMSPLGGIRQIMGDQVGDYSVIRGSDRVQVDAAGVPIDRPGIPTDRTRSDIGVVDQMRRELSNPPLDAGRPITPGAPPLQPGLLNNKPLDNKPLGAPPDGLSGPSLAPGVLPSSLNTNSSLRRQLITPAQQSTQMGELEKRLKESQGDQPLTDQAAQQQFRVMQAAAAARKAAITPSTAPPVPGTPGVPGAPGVVPPAVVPATPTRKPEPLAVRSLATGVKSPALAKVLTDAESLMKQGKFSAALDQYVLAEQGAPNNPLITVGRAHAELGGSSFRSAEIHIRQAILTDPAILVGKFDLKEMLGADRIAMLTKDLKDLSAKEPSELLAPFLLAYISYNTGGEKETAGYLNEVDKRLGVADTVVKLMRQNWTLPGESGLNK